MRIEAETFIKELQERYVQNPCQVSSIAFWKMARICRESETYRVVDHGHTCLYAIRGRRLECYWSDDRDRFILPKEQIRALGFLVLHEDFYRLIARDLTGYQVEQSHPLIYDFAFSQGTTHHEDYELAEFDFDREQEFVAAAALLNRCYPEASYTVEDVIGWRDQAVADDTLWIWAKTRGDRTPVGLGISTYQPSIRETYLDWIQVLPMVQRRGIGRMLVAETIHRAVEKSAIIRVTGRVDAFYQRCGFAGSERWHLISKR